MSYLIVGFVSLYGGVRALWLRRRQLGPEAARSSSVILRPGVLAVLAGLALACGVFLLADGILVMAQG
ncbi:hypothetical protein ACFYYN_21835 [Streptomyces sp. NPDC001902]|nr:hypothetical protein [Streptomyces sp. PA03-1a]MDX2813986.1 hypothetical protein [Streptomyces sp. PA03-5A]